MQKSTNKATHLFYWILSVGFASSPIFANSASLTGNSVWDFGVQALYLKPSFTNGFAYVDSTTISPNVDRKNPLKLDWDWGFKLEGSYHFCPHSDFNLNWYHYKNTSHDTFVFRTNPIADSYSITPDWDAINLEFGQFIHFDQIKSLRLHGGLQYAQVKTKYRGHGIDPIAGPGIENDTMEYNGIGPRIGADMSVGLFVNGLSVYFNGDIAMLVGRSKFNFNETFGTPYSISGSRDTDVVPEIGLKIGAKYDYTMPCSILVFDVGYLFINYFNVLHLQDNFASSETNFALNGLYAGIKWIVG